MSLTTEFLMKKYGPLLTYENLGELLSRSPDGIRISLRDKTGALSEFERQLQLAKKKLGRRVYFRTELVAKVISGDDA